MGVVGRAFGRGERRESLQLGLWEREVGAGETQPRPPGFECDVRLKRVDVWVFAVASPGLGQECDV